MLTEQRIYPNGLKLIVNQTDSPLACALVRVETGVAHEKKKYEGITTIIENMLLCGTASYPSKNSLKSAIDAFGGELYVTSCLDSTLIYIYCLPEHIDKAVSVLSQVVFSSVFSENNLVDIKKLIENYRKAQSDTPFLLAYDNLREIMFSGTGLDRNILGRKGAIGQLNSNDIKEFWKKVLCPSNLIVSVTGNVDVDLVYDLVMDGFYGKLIQSSGKQTKEILRVENSSSTRFVIDSKKLNQDRVLIGYLTDGACGKNYYATYLVKQILSSKIKDAFAGNDNIYFPSCYLNSYKNNGLLYLRFASETENVSTFIKNFADIVYKLSVDGISNAEFISQKEIFKTGFVKLFENSFEWSKMSAKFASYFNYNFDFEYELKKIDKITQGDCMSVIRSLVTAKPFISVVGSSKLNEKLYSDYFDRLKK